MALPFPDIDPVALSLGPLVIRWYSLAYLCGILMGWWYALQIVKKDEASGARPNRTDIDDYIPFAVMGIILGGRLGYILFYQPAYYFAHPLEMLHIWNGGMSFHGGVLGVVISVISYSLWRKIPMLRLGDLFAVCCTFGLFFGRLANFINGELFGRVTDAPVGMVFPNGGDLPRHPSQLYEAILEGLVLFVILSVLIHRKDVRSRPGIVIGVFLAGYGCFRMFIENFREPDAYLGFLSFGLTMGQILCIPMIVIGAGFVANAFRKNA